MDFIQSWTCCQPSICLLALLLVLLAVMIVKSCQGRRSTRMRMPPGPPRLPVVGHMVYMAVFGIEEFTNWAARRYGPVMTIWMGPKPKIFINDVELAKSAMRKYPVSFAGRPDSILGDAIADGTDGLGFGQYNGRLQFQRNLFSKLLKRISCSSGTFEDRVERYYSRFTDAMVQNEGTPYDPYRDLTIAQASLFYEMWNGHLDGQECTKDSLYMEAALFQNRFLGQYAGIVVLVEIWNSLKVIMASSYDKVTSLIFKFNAYFRNHCNERMLKKKGDSPDFLDLLIEEASKVTKEERELLQLTDDHMILRMLIDFNIGGLETIFRSIHWAMLYMAVNPEVQEKLHKELTATFGNGEPSLGQLKQIPYMTAVYHEVLRISSVAPYAVERGLLEDVKVGEWELPKGTNVFLNTIFYARDKQNFPDAETFRPDRFITDTGSFDIELRDKMMPFSFGRRICPGQGIARDIITKALSLIVTRCKFKFPPGSKPDLRRTVLITVEANPYKIVSESR